MAMHTDQDPNSDVAHPDGCPCSFCHDLVMLDLMAEREKVADDLGDSLLAVINDFIGTRNLHPQEASRVTLTMSKEMLGCLAWQPQSVQAAVGSIDEALLHLGG